ncbi:MAG: outer membrane lipoprotein carrier protein LolA [Cyanobacteria bacterium REEB65]|nr:outer membrane lipoprotein carrier protein LolA [Cyanobacteria bacterium REEB65]
MAVLLAAPGWCAPVHARHKRKKDSAHIPAAAVAAASTTFALPLLAPPTAPITVPYIVERFERLDRRLNTLSADFTQYVRWDESGMAQTVEGSFDYKKPGDMRLQHKLPERQLLVSDGTLLWIYRPSTNQVIKTRLEDWKKSEPMAQGLLDFGNYAGLLKSYDAEISSESAPGSDGQRDVWLRLKPKDKKQDFTLTLKLNTRDFFPADTELRAGSVSVHSIFSNIKYNPPEPEARFKFTPPPDADVFDNTKPKAQ